LLHLSLLLLALATPQSHPCDQPAANSATVSSQATMKVQFCAKASEAPDAVTVYVNGVAKVRSALTMVMAQNALGFALYEGPKELQFSRGSYVVELTVWAPEFPGGPSQESARSLPFSLAVVDSTPPPTAPKILGIIK
jgi:hypothetical protein